jgi:phosphatidylinositol alpha-1,6-mannosyltransferase
MKPLLFVTHQFNPTVGGSIRWTEQLCRDYRGGGVSVLTRDVGAEGDFEAEGVRVRRVPLRMVPWLRPESLLLYRNYCAAALQVAQKDRPAVVAAAGVAPDGLIALHLKRKLGLPYVVLAHGEEITVPMRSRRRPLTRYLKLEAMRRVFRCADRVIVNSRNTAQTVLDFAGPEVATQVLHPGTDAEVFSPAGPDLRAELGLGSRPVILTVGHLMHRKGQIRVLEALPQVLRQLPEAVYLMAGTGRHELAMRQAAALAGVEDSVRFLGHVPEQQLPALYRSADVFVLANRNLPDGDFEGFGIVYLEASASGLPVVVGERTGNADAVIDDVTALRVDPERPAEIAGALLRLLTDPELAGRLGAAGRTFVSEHFAPQLLAQRWNEILAQVTAAAAPPLWTSPSLSSAGSAAQRLTSSATITAARTRPRRS